MSARKKKKQESGEAGGGWLTTFADLMALLMCFFVMLFALSEVDKHKFEMLGYSLKKAFGVPVPTMIDSRSSDGINKSSKNNPIAMKSEEPIKEIIISVIQPVAFSIQQFHQKNQRQNQQQNQNIAQKDNTKNGQADAKKIKVANQATEVLKEMLEEELKHNIVEIRQKGKLVTMRLLGADAFQSGSAELTKNIEKTLYRFALAMKKIKGEITIEGHTDNNPIHTSQFRSNWDLSSARAATLIHHVGKYGIEKDRFTLKAYGEVKPVADNSTPAGRAQNRRIEIKIQPEDVVHFSNLRGDQEKK